MHKIEFEVIDAATEIEFIRFLDWFIGEPVGWNFRPPHGSKAMAKHIRHQIMESKRRK